MANKSKTSAVSSRPYSRKQTIPFIDKCNDISFGKPITLEELEAAILEPEQCTQHRDIKVEEQRAAEWKDRFERIEQALENQSRRGLRTAFVVVLFILVLTPLVFPDRYPMIDSLIKLLLLAAATVVSLAPIGKAYEKEADKQ